MQSNIGPPGSHASDDAVADRGARPREDGLNLVRNSTSRTNPWCVAICTVGELFGGIERHVLGMMSGLVANGVSIQLVLFHDGELAAQARGQGIAPIILPNSNRSLLATSRQLAHILHQHNVSVVHAHGYKATVFCSMARLQHRFAMVKTEHGLPEPTASGSICALRNRLYSFADIAATRLAHTMVCYVTEDLRTYYQHVHSGLQTLVIPNGVVEMDRPEFPPPLEMRDDWFNLLVVGRLDTVKGHHLAVEAIAAESVPPEIHLHIVGIGPREANLRALAQARGVANRVHFLGFQRNVYDYIAHCNVLLIPSLHEGLPYTLLEAMALGIPIIASSVGGLAEVIQDKRTGLLVPPQDATALAQAILRLHDDPALRSQLGDQARRLQQAKYSLEAMTERYLSVYRELAASGG